MRGTSIGSSSRHAAGTRKPGGGQRLSSNPPVRLSTVLSMPLTTQLDALRFPGTALVEVTVGNGLKRPSVALAFQLTAVDKQFIGANLGTLSEAAKQAVQQALDSIMERV